MTHMLHKWHIARLGLFEVTDILDYDPVRKEVYFMSTENPNLNAKEPQDPKLRNMFSMKIIESKVSANTRKLRRECRTCQESFWNSHHSLKI